MERWAKRCLLLRMQMAQKTESATTQLCKKPTFCSYTMVLVLWSRHSGQYQPNPPSLTLLQCRSGGRKNGPPPFPPNPKTRPQKKKRAKKGGEEKTFLLHFRNCHTSVWAGKRGEKKTFYDPLVSSSLFSSLQIPLTFSPLFLDHVSDRERGRKRREEEGGFGS